MDESNLMPGQVVQLEEGGEYYVVVQMEDGSMGLQQMPDYQNNENMTQELTALQNVDPTNVPESSIQTGNSIENPPQQMNVGEVKNETSHQQQQEVSVSEERYQQVAAFIEKLHSQGYDVDQDTLNLLLSGEMGIPEDLVIGEDGDQNSEVQTTQNDSNNVESQTDMHRLPTATDNKTSEQTIKEVVAPSYTTSTANNTTPLHRSGIRIDMNYNLDEDEEFKFFKVMLTLDEIGKPCKLPGSKPPQVNEFREAFINFVKSTGQGSSINGVELPREDHIPTTAPIVNGYPASSDEPFRNQYLFGDRSQSCFGGRGRGSAKLVQHRIAKRRNDSEDSDFEYEIPAYNHDEVMQQTFVPPSTRGKRGRPRGSTSKRYHESSSEDFSDFSDDSYHKPRRARPTNCPQNGQFQKRRGRPRKYPLPEIRVDPYQRPEAGNVLHTSNDDYHGYNIGDFVIERDEYFQKSSGDIYCINGLTDLMLNAYEVCVVNEIRHKLTPRVVGFAGKIRDRYKAVKVERYNLNHDGRYEFVKVVLPYEKRDLNQLQTHNLWGLFIVYVQVLVYHGLDSTVMTQVLNGSLEDYSGTFVQFENVVSECLNNILQRNSWKAHFKASLDDLPHYKMCNMTSIRPGHFQQCHELENSNLCANKVAKLFGPRYDYGLLAGQDTDNISDAEIEIMNGVNYFIHESSIKDIIVYHGLKHFKMMLHKEICRTISCIRNKDSSKTPDAIYNQVINNVRWMQYHFMLFTDFMTEAGITIEVQ